MRREGGSGMLLRKAYYSFLDDDLHEVRRVVCDGNGVKQPTASVSEKWHYQNSVKTI